MIWTYYGSEYLSYQAPGNSITMKILEVKHYVIWNHQKSEYNSFTQHVSLRVILSFNINFSVSYSKRRWEIYYSVQKSKMGGWYAYITSITV